MCWFLLDDIRGTLLLTQNVFVIYVQKYFTKVSVVMYVRVSFIRFQYFLDFSRHTLQPVRLYHLKSPNVLLTYVK